VLKNKNGHRIQVAEISWLRRILRDTRRNRVRNDDTIECVHEAADDNEQSNSDKTSRARSCDLNDNK
jgi:hypothetical protein